MKARVAAQPPDELQLETGRWRRVAAARVVMMTTAAAKQLERAICFVCSSVQGGGCIVIASGIYPVELVFGLLARSCEPSKHGGESVLHVFSLWLRPLSSVSSSSCTSLQVRPASTELQRKVKK